MSSCIRRGRGRPRPQGAIQKGKGPQRICARLQAGEDGSREHLFVLESATRAADVSPLSLSCTGVKRKKPCSESEIYTVRPAPFGKLGVQHRRRDAEEGAREQGRFWVFGDDGEFARLPASGSIRLHPREREGGSGNAPRGKQKQKGALCAPRSGLVGGSTTMGVAAWRVKEKNELKMRVIWLAFRGSTRRSKGACSSPSGYGEDDVCRVGCRSSS